MYTITLLYYILILTKWKIIRVVEYNNGFTESHNTELSRNSSHSKVPNKL